MLKRLFLNEQNIMIAILLNAAVLFVIYFPSYEHVSWLHWIDQLFILFFVIEAGVKIHSLGGKGYFDDGWNRFDFLLVVGSLPAILAYLLPVPDTSLILIFRVFRLVRILRFIKFIPNLHMVIAGLGRAVKASVFVFVALLFYNFILALVSCHFFKEIAPEYFGNPLISSYTVFQFFTIEGWNEIPATIALKMDNDYMIGFMRLYFVFIVLSGGMLGYSLATSVFVDEMTMDNNAVLEDKVDQLQLEIAELKRILLEQKS